MGYLKIIILISQILFICQSPGIFFLLLIITVEVIKANKRPDVKLGL